MTVNNLLLLVKKSIFMGMLLNCLCVQAERLSEFYEICKSMDIGRGDKFMKIEQVHILTPGLMLLKLF